MRNIRGISLLVAALLLGVVVDADGQTGRPKRRVKAKAKPKVPPVASKKTTVAIEQLLKPFKWGMSSQKVVGLLEQDIRKDYAKKLKAASNEPLEYDRVRREMMSYVSKLKKGLVQFAGKRVSWDVSMVDGEFAHKNNESMLVRWGGDDRRFYFFHNDRLWKVFIAFNAERFGGKTFADFAQVMEARFGRADRKYRATLKGDAQMAYLHWPPSKTTILRAMDNTRLYGNFCLILIDRHELPRVREGRKLNSPDKKTTDGLIDAVTRDDGEVSDRDEDIVDQITGGGSKVPVISDTASVDRPSRSASGSTGTATPPPRKKRKVDPKDPLKDLDL